MEPVKKRIEALKTALDRFVESITLFEESKTDRLYEQIRDSVIKRFEFCFDLFWKTLKDHLEEKHSVFVASPKSVIRELVNQKIIDQDVAEKITAMLDDRNNTTHTYDGVVAEQLAHHARIYYLLMIEVSQKISYKRLNMF